MTPGCRTHKKNFTAIFLAFFLFAFLGWNMPQAIAAAPAKTASTKPLKKHFVFVTVKSGDTVYSLFKKQDVSLKSLAVMMRNPQAARYLKRLHIGQGMRFSIDSSGVLESLVLTADRSHTLLIFRAGSHFNTRLEVGRLPTHTAVSLPHKNTAKPDKPIPKLAKNPSLKIIPIKKVVKKLEIVQKKHSIPTLLRISSPSLVAEKTVAKLMVKPIINKPLIHKLSNALHFKGIKLHSSLVNDGTKQSVPYKLISQLIKIFALQINFKTIRSGDKVVFAYNEVSLNKKRVPGDIIAAQWTQGKHIYTAIRYVNKQGVAEYFSAEGVGRNKAFDRFPVKYTHINSLFNMHRMHPVTHVVRPHTGIDLAAPIGTPMYSIGDGKITFIGWEGAYGNIVKIQHDEKYSSMYAHMLRFAPGLSKNSTVKRGQLIGFLGQTGNATGPHVHFEVRIHNVPVNPLTVELPYATGIPAIQMKAFQQRAKLLMADLNQYQQVHLQ